MTTREPPREAMPSSVLFDVLTTRCKELLEHARKEVYKNALKRLPRNVRGSKLGDDIITFNVGSYISTPKSVNLLFHLVKESDDAHRRLRGEAPLSYDEVWDKMGSFILIFMIGFRDKHKLNPSIPAGQFRIAFIVIGIYKRAPFGARYCYGDMHVAPSLIRGRFPLPISVTIPSMKWFKAPSAICVWS